MLKTIATAAFIALTATGAVAQSADELHNAGYNAELMTQLDWKCSDELVFDDVAQEIVLFTLTQDYADTQDAMPDFAAGTIAAQDTVYELTREFLYEGFNHDQSERLMCAVIAASVDHVSIK